MPAELRERRRAIEAVVNVLSPPPKGIPIFEWGHETTPTPQEIEELATKIVDAIEEVRD